MPAVGSETADEFRCNGAIATIVGTIGDDTLRGTNGRDVIVGRGGDDTIMGLRGNDILCGDAGNDRLYGNDGHDELVGGPGDDLLKGGTVPTYDGSGARVPSGTASYIENPRGVTVDLQAGVATGAGTDTLRNIIDVEGSMFDDVLIGDRRDNDLNGYEGRDTIMGGGGNDTLSGGGGKDHLAGGSGDDTLYGQNGNDFLEGNGGHDELYGCNGYACTDDLRDRINGGMGDDFIDGDTGDDIINGGGGNDTLDGDVGDDLVVGRSGYDLAFSAETPRTLEEIALGPRCTECSRSVYRTNEERLTLWIYDRDWTSRANWYDSTGTEIDQNPGDCPRLVTVYGPSYAAHYFYIECATRPPGAYRVTCNGTTACDAGTAGGWFFVTDR